MGSEMCIRDREKIPYFGWRAAFLGAVLAAACGAFATAFRFCLGSAFYTKRDITVRLGLPVYGMTFEPARRERECGVSRRQAEMLAGGLSMLAQQYRKIVLLDAAQGQEASAFLEEITRRGLIDNICCEICDRKKELYEGQETAFVAVIPFGRTYREKITDEIQYVQLRGGRVVGAVLVQAQTWWMRFYYAQGRS